MNMEKSAVELVSIEEADAGQRIDRWFRRRFPQLRQGEIEKLLRTGQVRVEGGRVKANHRLEAGVQVRIPPLRAGAEAESRAVGQNGKDSSEFREISQDFLQDILIYEDQDILVLNKPFGLAVQGGSKTKTHLDGMLASLAKGDNRPRLVHRLDRDTGGIIVTAKTRAAAAHLSESFRAKRVRKLYWALVRGVPKPEEGQIESALEKQQDRIKLHERVAPSRSMDAKRALTDYALVENAGRRASWVALSPLTGRTHQLRVHMAEFGCPIIGDPKYGEGERTLHGIAKRLHLFARALSFPHPRTGARTTLYAPLTDHMRETWDVFGFDKDNTDDPFEDQ